MARILVGDCRDTLKTLPDGSVQCVVTSPPYYGLRDYGTADWEGGDPECRHVRKNARNDAGASGGIRDGRAPAGEIQYSGFCADCGALRIDRQIGLEPTPDEYVAALVGVFREVRRVLRDDGTVWLNLGDSYAGSWKNQGRKDERGTQRPINGPMLQSFDGHPAPDSNAGQVPDGLKPKDLIGIPWSVAKALQEPFYAGRIARGADRAWLAAIIDGEGSITASRHKRKDDGRIRTLGGVFVTNSCERMLARCAEIWPGASRHEHIRNGPGHLGQRACFRWIPTSAEDKAALLRELYPHLITKRTQALLTWNLLEFQKDGRRLGKSRIAAAVRAKRERLVELIHVANAGQDVDVPDWCKEPPTLFEPGWYLRSDIIWAKPNPMPESVQDRPTKAHEYVFLLSKSERYYFDADAIAEPLAVEPHAPGNIAGKDGGHLRKDFGTDRMQAVWGKNGTRNARTVWTIATQPYAEAHFATFPEELARRCIVAGTSQRGCCPECGAPWGRIVERDRTNESNAGRAAARSGVVTLDGKGHPSTQVRENHDIRLGPTIRTKTIGWQPSCDHDGEPVPCVVLDPFAGSGTVGAVAVGNGRDAILCELNPEYIEMARQRVGPMFVVGAA